ncbi:hypothetical protein [Antrihabitans spumae]|jgi:hypothetical protein|uniref:Uncharacterized protein n=1 Tax=Antrihabitans spumae TaxID=3373370 RepID=A0ABW7K648_9NOCA
MRRQLRATLLTLPAAAALVCLGAGTASADATITGAGGPGKVITNVANDGTARECDVHVVNQLNQTVASKHVSLAPNARKTVKLYHIPPASYYIVVMDCTGQQRTYIDGGVVVTPSDPLTDFIDTISDAAGS